jgi:hypothetical protein
MGVGRVLCIVVMLVIHNALRPPMRLFMRQMSDAKIVAIIGGGAAGYFSAIECANELQKHNVAKQVCTPSLIRRYVY